ncbi:hypothetical protein [Pseudofrankia sp. DC12]|uniref:hypothetical protein n=1 Tax=Pseudofrankia sp. DC12 TaxID=683315 RepID=UPI0005F8257E|nr:hypothetical protein [Pseudofrankia sp. DC12]
MPCYRCDTRQTDPARGASPWARAVVGGEQVLVCPECQRDPGWRHPLDRCVGCGSARLAKALGLVVCRDCGRRTEPGGQQPGPGDPLIQGSAHEPGRGDPPGAGNATLAGDVAAALARMFGQPTTVVPSPDEATDR